MLGGGVDAAAQMRLVLQTATYRRQLETLLTAQTRLVLQTATYRRQKSKKHAERHENIDSMKWPLRAHGAASAAAFEALRN